MTDAACETNADPNGLLARVAQELEGLSARIDPIEDCLARAVVERAVPSGTDRTALQDLDHVRQSLDALAGLLHCIGRDATASAQSQAALDALPLEAMRRRLAGLGAGLGDSETRRGGAGDNQIDMF